MSNINKQALREAAQKATGAHDRLSVMPADDIFDISQHEGTQLDADITALNSFNSAANPATVLALLDELEAAEKRVAELELRLSQQQSIAANNLDMFRRADARVSELEARELVVNLPAYVDGRTLGYGEVNHMIDLCADAIEKAGHTAGIITKVGE